MRKFLRRLGIGLGALVLVLAVTAGGIHVAGGRKLARTYAVTPHPPAEAPEATESWPWVRAPRGRRLRPAPDPRTNRAAQAARLR